ncbi:RelA/SpoT family protein [Granulosicoccus antarcticus]|uniref:GTP pyrophosphokinase n=1 Tax=Granulosicoccus antarcticus IMCC3135 TaxID=1192854 RepID=A0A2Z2NZJ2_9GAMM|nr:bifunctional (p)ppGpp synthetase/guanosine-3',5'-bis(diphosphate) 3'-pyrophosphohydrolase [Granulosicoccus antarcticus]ASJ75361.1 GTP pyrophosphokinase [Granulosicoccus antarcticus IMCC3135]
MRHTYSPDDEAFATMESSQDYLTENCTRNQALIIRRAVEHCWAVRERKTGYPEAIHVAGQLKQMRADMPILVSALLGTDVAAKEYSIDFVREHYGQEIAQLTDGVRWLNALTISDAFGSGDQAETLRRMVLTMVTDVRVVLVKLAYRTQRLYQLIKTGPVERSIAVAQETLTIYTPLANRLGLGQLKWELEDVAFRIVEPEAYKRIAKALEENRASREVYIEDFVNDLSNRVESHGIKIASVFGRPKHIYSIWKKMRDKHIGFSDLFDVRAVRVLVDDIQQCYSVLGIAHSIWQPISREFDDYIANPKGNGYRSLHTAVIGPRGKPVEIQIRTRLMDDDAENGVAAHWAYKEGAPVDLNLQKGINALRQLLDDNDDEFLVEGFSQQLDSQRVYVFTPKGEVIDLSKGATPLDFAYHVHSEIGHRCRGAKINGRIVPLTYALTNGDQVEILTTREPAPSRDWLNQSLGYINSSRARGKVRAWFNQQDHDQQLSDGRSILDRELKRYRATSLAIDTLVKRLKFDKANDLFVAIGRNDVTVSQIVGAIDHLAEPVARSTDIVNRQDSLDHSNSAIHVRGVGNLLTTIAPCCQAVPPDSIVGFITRGKGVTIHRADCSNILNLRESERERLIDVDWGESGSSRYRVEIHIIAYDRNGLLRDVSTVLSALNVDVVSVNTLSDEASQTADMKIGLHIANTSELTTIMDKIRQLRNVQDVERVN